MSYSSKKDDLEDTLTRVLCYQDQSLKNICFSYIQGAEDVISKSENLLCELGYSEQVHESQQYCVEKSRSILVYPPSWEQVCEEAEKALPGTYALEDLFTEEELNLNHQFIDQIKNDYENLHKLDALDYMICGFSAIIAASVDILMVGIPQKGKNGISAAPLSDFIRRKFDQLLPTEKMENLANSNSSKVPYDAQDNRNTKTDVIGLSTYYHRLLSLGHDPFLGFVVGVFDIMTGRMTTIDKTGHFVSQIMDCYEARRETNLFTAIAKEFAHLKSDVTTSMGLPAPLMGLFNLLQIGQIGEENQTIAEIVQGMYYEGYDFIHFCSMSVPTIIVEVMVRVLYCLKKVKSGSALKDSIPFSTDRTKQSKLGTMLFLAHSGATAINAGKVFFTQNPLAINYTQWMAFAKYSYQQIKWQMFIKRDLQDKYVKDALNKSWTELYEDIDNTFAAVLGSRIITFAANENFKISTTINSLQTS